MACVMISMSHGTICHPWTITDHGATRFISKKASWNPPVTTWRLHVCYRYRLSSTSSLLSLSARAIKWDIIIIVGILLSTLSFEAHTVPLPGTFGPQSSSLHFHKNNYLKNLGIYPVFFFAPFHPFPLHSSTGFLSSPLDLWNNPPIFCPLLAFSICTRPVWLCISFTIRCSFIHT